MNKKILGSCMLEFKLSQLTPLIHFKNETGNSIRATEMKPKLDRYISKYIKKNEIEIKQEWLSYGDKDWFLSEGDTEKGMLLAYDYKLRIKTGIDQSTIRSYKKTVNSTSAIGAYFWTGSDPRFNSYYGQIIVEVLCKNKELKELVKDIFPEFISGTTFGFRQDKGYGYFFVDQEETTVEKQRQLIEKYINTFNKRDNKRIQLYKLNKIGGTYEQCLKKIKDFNRDIKSGEKNSGSFMLNDYSYPDRSSVIHEKNAMYLTLKNIDLKNKEKIWYIRGLLGFADHYQSSNKKEFKIKVYENGEEQKNFRFASPMRFIPAVDFKTVFLLFDLEAVHKLQEKSNSLDIVFEYSTSKKFTAKIPGSKSYDITNMLDSYILNRNKYGLEKIN
ncbi:hypothetical protein [Anaerostipes sp.]|uniref:hypothetical protein n=1 Tax=Anaerostipes sp. TaxID=1872530 RepID=UPI0025BE58B1|nr:hypothetical protein [Anaerostipes sp.]MBS7007941.1 hypothetical protein [Anaerostipes sp.]